LEVLTFAFRATGLAGGVGEQDMDARLFVTCPEPVHRV
jgi:hypothetical protein